MVKVWFEVWLTPLDLRLLAEVDVTWALCATGAAASALSENIKFSICIMSAEIHELGAGLVSALVMFRWIMTGLSFANPGLGWDFHPSEQWWGLLAVVSSVHFGNNRPLLCNPPWALARTALMLSALNR